MIKIVAAMSLDRVIGVYPNKRKVGKLPWKKISAKGDLTHFHNLTLGAPVIMGRKTFESIGGGGLPNRENIIVTNRLITLHKTATNIKDAIGIAKNHLDPFHRGNKDVWLVGGNRIFGEGQRFADEILITVIPYMAYEEYDADQCVYFPSIDNRKFKRVASSHHPINRSLRIIRYGRRK